MSTILISGIAGFLGSNLADRLLKDGHEVIGLDNMIGGDLANVPNNATFYNVDCTDLTATKNVFLKHDVEIVYHCAASPHEGLSVFSPCIVNKNTYMSTIGLATAALDVGTVRRFVFTSSMARYGHGGMLPPFTEEYPTKPVDPYGHAKVNSENILRCLTDEHGMELVILVPHNVTGIKQKRDDPFRNVVAIMMNLILQGRQPFIYGDGEQKRCFSFIDDVMDSLVNAGFQDGLHGEVINIGPDEGFVTINYLAKLIADIFDFDLKPIYMPDRPCEVKSAYCSSAKARNILGYRTRISLKDGLCSMADWMRRVGPRDFIHHLPIEIHGDRLPPTWKYELFKKP